MPLPLAGDRWSPGALEIMEDARDESRLPGWSILAPELDLLDMECVSREFLDTLSARTSLSLPFPLELDVLPFDFFASAL